MPAGLIEHSRGQSPVFYTYQILGDTKHWDQAAVLSPHRNTQYLGLVKMGPAMLGFARDNLVGVL